MKIKNLKPTDIESNFKYECPKCGYDHWISFKEANTNGFKIVCDGCDTVFKPKRISKLIIKYYRTKNVLDKKILQQCCQILYQYSFDNTEAEKLILDAYADIKTQDIGKLIKAAIKIFGEKKYD